MTLEKKTRDSKAKYFMFGLVFGLFFGFIFAMGVILYYPEQTQNSIINDEILSIEIGYYGDGIVDIHGVKVNCHNINGIIPQACIDIQYHISPSQKQESGS